MLAAANAVTDADLVAGTTLRAPQVTTTANDASTFKPYDPNAILGPTTPSLPYIAPPPEQHCNAVMSVLMAAVAVVVAVYAPMLAPAMSGFFGGAAISAGAFAGATVGGAMAASFVVGAAASAVAQGVGSALGATTFSWRRVASDGMTAALTAGLANSTSVGKLADVFGGSKFAQGAVSGVLGNLGNQLTQRIAGIESHFSWTSVAASAISSGISRSITPLLTKDLGEVASDFVAGMVGGTVSLHVRRAMGFEDEINYGAILADAFGNALATAATSRRNPRSAPSIGQEPAAEASLGVWDGSLMTQVPPYQPAMGSFSSEYTTTATITWGDQPRSTAINVGPAAPYEIGASEGGATNLAPVVVTGNYAHDSWYMSLWDWSSRYHMPPPPTDGKYASLVRYSDEATRALAPTYNAYMKRAFQGQTVSLGGGMTSAEFEQQWRTTGVNGLLGKLAEPFVQARAWVDGALAPIEGALQTWGAFNRDLSMNPGDYAGSAVGAGGYAALGAFNAGVADILGGTVGGLRMVTNTERLASTAGGIEALLGARPSDTAAKVLDAWNGMSLLEKEQAGLTMLMGVGLSASRLSRFGVVDRAISTGYGEMLIGEKIANSSLSGVELKAFTPVRGDAYKALAEADRKPFLREYAKQVSGQEAAINRLTVNDYLAARRMYESSGRNLSSKAGQRKFAADFESQVRNNIYQDLLESGHSPRQARDLSTQRASEVRSNLAALHEPDMVAGGWASPMPTRMGNAAVNSSIGGSWRIRLPALDAWALQAAQDGYGASLMNVRLRVQGW